MFTRCLLLIVLLAITSCVFAQQSRSCNIFGHGHIATFAGEQFHITMPGDYLLTGDFVVRLEQCPGSKPGAVCLTGFKTSSEEVYYNRETNTCEKHMGGNLQACTNSFDGVLRGFHESGTGYEYTFTSYGSSLTIREFDGINNGTDLGLCGKRRFLSTGRADQDWEDTADAFYPSEANQAEINKYAHTHTVNTQSRDTFQFGYRTERADPGFGDFSSWKSYAPKNLDESTCSRIGRINSFLGKACSYDVKAAGTNNARVAAYWALRDSCWSVFNTYNRNGLVGLFADYDDLAICDPVLSENYMEVLHDFKDSDQHPFDVDAEPLAPEKSIMNKEGFIQDRFAITPNHNVGGKYTYRVRYRDECGKEIDHTTQVNIRCNAPPKVNAGEDMSFERNTPIVVRAKMSDEDGDNLVFSWKFIDWPDKETGASIDDRVSDPTGYGSEYFHFQPTHVGRYTLQLAVSDYCNVAFDTINIDSFCNECDEKLVLDQDGKFEHPGTNDGLMDYGTVTFKNVDPDFEPLEPSNSPEFQTVEVSVLNDEYQLERKDLSPGYEWEVRTSYDINGPNEDTVTDSNTDDCVGNSTESFVQRLRIPPYAFRGKTVLDVGYSSDDYVDEFRRVSEEVMHHQYYCYEQRTEKTTTTTTWTYDPPTTPVCKLDVGTIDGETSLEFAYSRMNTDGTGYSLNRCDHSFEFTFNATGDCSTQSSSAIATAKCPIPQANPTCPDVIYFDYDTLSFTSVDLDGRDSSSGALEDATQTSYPTGWLNYNWELVSKPSSSGSISNPSNPEATLDSISRPGDYQIRLTVDNNCRSNEGEIMVTAVCGLPVPSNMSSITIEEDPNHNIDVDARGVQAARDDLALTATVYVTSWPDELNTRISKINEYVSPGDIIAEPDDSEMVTTGSAENVLSAGVAYENIMVAGDHTFSVDVSDPCHGTSGEQTVPLSCPHESFTLDVSVNGLEPGNLPTYTYNDTGYPSFDIYGSISGADLDSTWRTYLKVERDNGDVFRYGDPETETGTDFEYIGANAIVLTSSGTYNFKLLATDSDRCHTQEQTWSVTVECPNAPTISSTTAQTATTYASKSNETESIIFSASFSAPADTDPGVQWQFKQDDDQWVEVGSATGIPFSVVHDNATTGETSGDAYLELEVGDYALLGTYSFRAFISYGGDSDNECGTDNVEYTVTVECPRADVGVDANPNGLSTSYTFTDNHFPTVRVKGGISNNDEYVTPIEEYRYMWIFTSVPDNSAYFPETSETTPEQPYPYPDYTDVNDNEDDDTQDGRTVLTGRTRVVEQFKHFRTYKVYRHSVLNAADVSANDPETFGFKEFSVLYDRDDHDFDGCFVPDVAGTYTLRFETRPELGSATNDFPAQCALTDSLDIQVNCNNAPSISLEGADADGVLSVTKTALHADRVQLHFNIENDDQHMIHSELVSSPFDTVQPVSTPELWEEHSERPSFLASRAGDYVIRITADDGCTRTTEEFTIRVTCSNGISFGEESKTYTVDYSSKVDISQMSFPVLPSTNDKFSCMVHTTPDVSPNQQSGFVDIELVDWEAPDRIPEPEPSSESTTGRDDNDSTSGAVPMVSFQPQAIVMALVAALLALLM